MATGTIPGPAVIPGKTSLRGRLNKNGPPPSWRDPRRINVANSCGHFEAPSHSEFSHVRFVPANEVGKRLCLFEESSPAFGHCIYTVQPKQTDCIHQRLKHGGSKNKRVGRGVALLARGLVIFERRILLGCTVLVGLSVCIWLVAIGTDHWFTVESPDKEGLPLGGLSKGKRLIYRHSGLWKGCVEGLAPNSENSTEMIPFSKRCMTSTWLLDCGCDTTSMDFKTVGAQKISSERNPTVLTCPAIY
ncbi:hypothetical protein WN48_06957 [Eufriesea mexicana]|uniref:Uncharacterized protein n=1 Tax=Eufriesea mexicana TaxID=516756 RepID=A0A310SUR4_9HYME|nr:hypothetical protein WN48_06957 [Eufriesea mexicana]